MRTNKLMIGAGLVLSIALFGTYSAASDTAVEGPHLPLPTDYDVDGDALRSPEAKALISKYANIWFKDSFAMNMTDVEIFKAEFRQNLGIKSNIKVTAELDEPGRYHVDVYVPHGDKQVWDYHYYVEKKGGQYQAISDSAPVAIQTGDDEQAARAYETPAVLASDTTEQE